MGPALQQIFCRAGPVCPAEDAVRNGGQENPAPTDRLMVRWDGPMWASAPTERLPIESHIALHGRRSGNAKARDEICSFPFARRKGTDAGSTSPAERISKPWFWRRSFLPFFRCRKKGSRRRHLQAQGVRCKPGRWAVGSPPYGVILWSVEHAQIFLAISAQRRNHAGSYFC